MSDPIRPGSIDAYLDPPDIPDRIEMRISEAPDSAILRYFLEVVRSEKVVSHRGVNFMRGFLIDQGYSWLQLDEEETRAYLEPPEPLMEWEK